MSPDRDDLVTADDRARAQAGLEAALEARDKRRTGGAIARDKRLDAMTVEDHVRRQRGERVESDEYIAARRKALEAAGLEPDDDGADRPLEQMTADDHFNRRNR